jgi:NADH-quinone oxidoreductase subunit C
VSPLALAPEELTAAFCDALGADVVRTSTSHGNAVVEVTPSAWTQALAFARDDAGVDCDFFAFVSAIDCVPDEATAKAAEENPEPAEDVYVPSNHDGYEVVARVSSSAAVHGVTVKASLPRDGAAIDTLTGVYEGADWHEREIIDMFGIEVIGHPNPARIYLTDEFEGHPLRKSFKLGAREVKPWPGDVDVEDMPDDAPVLDDAGNVVELAEPEPAEAAAETGDDA